MADKRSFYAWRITQRKNKEAIRFVAFIANAKDISKWAGIRRVGEFEKGTQRRLIPARVLAIQNFFLADNRNTIPTSVILAFSPETSDFRVIEDKCIEEFPQILEGIKNNRTEIGVFSFEFEKNMKEHERPALIVDGQHRLAGMAQLEEDMPIMVIALYDASPDEQAFQFVVINNKAAKVKTDNVKAIISDIQDDNDFKERLAKARVNYGEYPSILREIGDRDDSPFLNLLDWPLNPKLNQFREEEKPLVNLTAIEACIRYIKNNIPEVEYDNDVDTIKELFLAVWRVIADTYQDLWRVNEQFMSKVNINALNEYVIDRIENAWFDKAVDIYEVHDIEKYVRDKLTDIPGQYWELEWQRALQDNKVIRDIIKGDLQRIVRNQRSRGIEDWNSGLEMIGQSD